MKELLIISYIGGFSWVGVYIGDDLAFDGETDGEWYIMVPQAIQQAGGVSGARWIQWTESTEGGKWFETERDGMGMPRLLSEIPAEHLQVAA